MTNESSKDIDYNKYMKRISSEDLPVYKPELGQREIELLGEVINSNWISEGRFTRKFESELSKISGKKYALCFCNATAAIVTGMKALGIGSGDQVIVPSFSHSADPNSISAVNATPIFADVNYHTMCLNVEEIKRVLTNKTKAVLYVSAYGNTDDLDEISEFCGRHNLLLINDCAPALGGLYRGKPISSYGDFSVFSFFADKTITTGEGGVMLTNNKELIRRSNIYKHDGRRERGIDLIEERGFNYRITEMQSALGVAQMERLEYFIKRKTEILQYYKSKFSDSKRFRVFDFNKEADAVPHRVVLFTQDASALISHLVAKGIGARTLFIPMHSQPCYSVDTEFVNSQRLYSEGLELPSYPSLKNSEIDYIATVIQSHDR